MRDSGDGWENGNLYKVELRRNTYSRDYTFFVVADCAEAAIGVARRYWREREKCAEGEDVICMSASLEKRGILIRSY